ncbi:hypothetical protein [Natronobeatus ordinarius]|uniref:hypothetical protein n=1 Tax=Natronobeatus ordinarius TaxID=2963433 RepID=UPI0020CBE722|nr:hypothetical protein [Natronobeatus ordinarius]
MGKINRRRLIGVTSVGIMMPLFGCLGMTSDPDDGDEEDMTESTTNRNDAEQSNRSNDMGENIPLGGSGTLKIQNLSEEAQNIDLHVENKTNGGTILDISVNLESDDEILAMGVLSREIAYEVNVQSGDLEKTHAWEIEEGDNLVNVTARIGDDELDFFLLSPQ